MYGVQASFLSEMFPPNLRYSGASLGYQIAAPLGGGLVPFVAAALVGLTHGATWPVSVLMIVIALMSIFAVLAARETVPILTKDPITGHLVPVHESGFGTNRMRQVAVSDLISGVDGPRTLDPLR